MFSIKLPLLANSLIYFTSTMHNSKYFDILAGFYNPVNDPVILENDLSKSITLPVNCCLPFLSTLFCPLFDSAKKLLGS